MVFKKGGIMLKKCIITIVLIVLICNFLISNENNIIENPENPQAKNAGRQAKITEIFRIIDDGGEFYFKSPSRLGVAPDDSIFVTDDKQFLKFDKQGKFVANLQKTGEGPGEYNYLMSYQILGDRLIINTFQPHKLLICDLSGKLIKETRLNANFGFKRVVGIFSDKYYYFYGKLDINEIKSGLQVLNLGLNVSTFDGKVTDLKLTLPQRQFSKKSVSKTGAVRVSIVSLDNFSYALENEHSIFISHSADYMIKHVDLATGKVIKQFNRKYKSVPYVESKPKENSRTSKGFKKEFFSDVSKMALFRDKIWVFTSTLDEKKGVLVDVFSKEGKYVDNFYIPLPQVNRPDDLERRSFFIKEDFLYIVEPDEEEIPTIVKYKIEF